VLKCQALIPGDVGVFALDLLVQTDCGAQCVPACVVWACVCAWVWVCVRVGAGVCVCVCGDVLLRHEEQGTSGQVRDFTSRAAVVISND
jgi:hypothetical protein